MISTTFDTDHECDTDDIVFLMSEYIETVPEKHIFIIIVDIHILYKFSYI